MEFRRAREAGFKAKIMRAYMSESNAKKAAARKAEQRRRLVQRYKRERHEERSARFTGKSPFGALGGHKMEAFRRTEYGDDKERTLASRWTQ